MHDIYHDGIIGDDVESHTVSSNGPVQQTKKSNVKRIPVKLLQALQDARKVRRCCIKTLYAKMVSKQAGKKDQLDQALKNEGEVVEAKKHRKHDGTKDKLDEVLESQEKIVDLLKERKQGRSHKAKVDATKKLISSLIDKTKTTIHYDDKDCIEENGEIRKCSKKADDDDVDEDVEDDEEERKGNTATDSDDDGKNLEIDSEGASIEVSAKDGGLGSAKDISAKDLEDVKKVHYYFFRAIV